MRLQKLLCLVVLLLASLLPAAGQRPGKQPLGAILAPLPLGPPPSFCRPAGEAGAANPLPEPGTPKAAGAMRGL